MLKTTSRLVTSAAGNGSGLIRRCRFEADGADVAAAA